MSLANHYIFLNILKENGINMYTQKQVIIILHGLGMSSLSLKYIGTQIHKSGMDVIYIDYPSKKRSIDELVEGILEDISKLSLEQYDCVHLLGHSLGGVIARMLVHEDYFNNHTKIIALGAPNRGSSLALWLQKYKFFRWYFGPAFLELAYHSNFIKKLPLLPKNYYLITGRKSSISPFGWWFNEPSDGTVAISESLLDTLDKKNYFEFNVSHTSMLFSKKIVQCILDILS